MSDFSGNDVAEPVDVANGGHNGEAEGNSEQQQNNADDAKSGWFLFNNAFQNNRFCQP